MQLVLGGTVPPKPDTYRGWSRLAKNKVHPQNGKSEGGNNFKQMESWGGVVEVSRRATAPAERPHPQSLFITEFMAVPH